MFDEMMMEFLIAVATSAVIFGLISLWRPLISASFRMLSFFLVKISRLIQQVKTVIQWKDELNSIQ
jgi:hypothetical protein